MEQNIIETFQSLQLTKEEEEDISISSASRLELLEECSLSLFRRLLLDRQQNLRALKSTLKSMWKMCSDLRIVEVGNNTLQFKFSSGIKWSGWKKVGPGTSTIIFFFYADGKKGLTLANISFTYSPFWVQIW